MMAGPLGFFFFPIVGVVMVLGLIAVGILRARALKYQERLQADESLVLVHGSTADARRAHQILEGTAQTHLQRHGISTLDSRHSQPQMRI